MGDPASVDFDVDMQTIRDYVASVVEAKAKIATSFLTAIENFQTTVTSASPADARPNFLGAVLKSGLKSIEKASVSAVKDATGADLGPLVDVIHAVSDEIDRAAAATQSLAVADWIKSARTTIANAYTQDQTGEALRLRLENEYKSNDEGGRGGYIAGIQNELAAMGKVQAPIAQIPEVSMYLAWINQNFNNDCIDGTGIVYIQYADDGTLTSASVVAPLGDKIAGALNSQMTSAGVSRLMDLDVVKKACKGSDCMCFEGNNVVRKAATDDQNQAFLKNESTWKLAVSFS
jgi:hypothetical protein